MQVVTVHRFGGPEELQLSEMETPAPGPGEVLLRLQSIGLNHADLMSRRGEYKLASGNPPFTPGIEGGGIIEAVGEGVDPKLAGRRATLSADAPRSATGGMQGTYRSHFITLVDKIILVPDKVPDEQLGAIWLPFLTAWGCLVWKQNLQPGQVVAMPAASSSVALAAAQVSRQAGAITIGMTSSPGKIAQLESMPEAAYDHLVCTHNPDRTMKRWHKDLQRLTDGRGVDVFFDPVAAGAYLDMEIRALAQHGTIWVYGLLGKPDAVDVSPLIRKYAAIRGWVMGEIVSEGGPDLARGYGEILGGFAEGTYRQVVGKQYQLADVRHAHEEMEAGDHIGKLVMVV